MLSVRQCVRPCVSLKWFPDCNSNSFVKILMGVGAVIVLHTIPQNPIDFGGQRSRSLWNLLPGQGI